MCCWLRCHEERSTCRQLMGVFVAVSLGVDYQMSVALEVKTRAFGEKAICVAHESLVTHLIVEMVEHSHCCFLLFQILDLIVHHNNCESLAV